MTATLTRLPGSALPWTYAVQFSYDAALHDLLLRRIPQRQRKWQARARSWWIQEAAYEPMLATLTEKNVEVQWAK